jgi:hypothetical protein
VSDERSPTWIPQNHGVRARQYGSVGEIQWRRLQTGHIQDRDICVGIEGHHAGIVLLTVDRDGDAFCTSHHMCVGHHAIRSENETAAVQDLLARLRDALDLDDAACCVRHDDAARQRLVRSLDADHR